MDAVPLLQSRASHSSGIDSMARDNLNDILVFLAVARERSFTRAAARLGVTQSALSHTVRALEARLGVRLLTRTTRSVAPTEAGERLLQSVAPRLEEIEAEIEAVSELGDKVAGTIRITAIDHVVENVLWPRLVGLLARYPDLRVEITSDYRLVDIVGERYDIGVRTGDLVEQDMVAVRLTPHLDTVIVGAPAYFARHPVPRTPQDLLSHNCITLRLPSSGGIYAWELGKDGETVQAKVGGQATFSTAPAMVNAALSGIGLAFVTRDLAEAHIRDGRLISVMDDWCPGFPGVHAYYSSRRHMSRALALVIEAIRMPS
jgi:DNA-binding transcriptional LysR family regulator